MKQIKLLLIFVIFALIIPFSFSYTVLVNDSCDVGDNFSSSGGSFDGRCNWAGANSYIKTVHPFPNISTNGNTNISIRYDMNITTAGVGANVETLCWVNDSTIATNCYTQHNLNPSFAWNNGVEDFALTGFIKDGTNQRIRIDILTNATWMIYLNETLLHAMPNRVADMRNVTTKVLGQSNENTAGSFDNWVVINLTTKELIPPEITLINLTSEGGLGQIIYEGGVSNNKQTEPIVRTNDTTPTFFVITNENSNCAVIDLNRDLNYSDITVGSSGCATTGTTIHICTLGNNNATGRTGLHNFSIGCQDLTNNQNSTSTSGKFLINITDPTPPQVNLAKPDNNALFQIGINNTNIRFNATSTDNVDLTYNCTGYIDNVQEFNNATYTNNTEFNFSKTISTMGTHTWNITCIDSFNNINSSQRSFDLEQLGAVYLFLDLLNDSRKYEYRTKANITANCTERLSGTCQVEISLDAPGYGINYSFGNNFTSFIFNITTLRISNFSHGPSSYILTSSGIVNVSSNNKTEITQVKINITNSGSSNNINISIYKGNQSKTKYLFGDLSTKYLQQTLFIYNNEYKNAVNLTYLTKGSNFIYSNLTNIDNTINLTFQLSGFDLDVENTFSYIERFNGTDGSKNFNNTLSFQIDAPLGYFDDFEINRSGIWTETLVEESSECVVIYSNGNDNDYFEISGSAATACTFQSCTATLNYNDKLADLINTSRIELMYKESASTSAGSEGASGGAVVIIRATDGTNKITLRETSSIPHLLRNFTLIKKSSDYKIWEIIVNGTSSGNKDLSSLNFNNQIKLQFEISASAGGPCAGSAGSGTATLQLYDLKWGGAILNRSTNNGTYKSEGNITYEVNVTKTNISQAILTLTKYEPSGTNIFPFLSNTCNATNPTFESVTSGRSHLFGTTGNELCVRFQLNSSSNITSPVVRKYEIEIIPTPIENITVDLNDDGSDEFIYTGKLNTTTSPIHVNLTPLSNKNNIIKISTSTGGLLQINNFKMNASINPISLNKTFFEDCTNCLINFTFSGDSITISDLKFDFLGSWNYTIEARSQGLIKKFIAQIYYSNFNFSFPSKISFYDVFPSSNNVSNVTPFGQSKTHPIWNISNLAYDESIDIYVKTNKTLNACLNITYSNNSIFYGNIVNESFTWINGTSISLDKKNIRNGSDVIFNQTSGYIISSNNYSINYSSGKIILTSNYGNREQFGINYSYEIYGYDLNQNYTFKLNTSYQKIISNLSIGRLNFSQFNESINISIIKINSTNSTFLRNSYIISIAVQNRTTEDILIENSEFKLNYDTGYFTFSNL